MLTWLFGQRRIIIAITRTELAKRYSGTLLGVFWVIIYPILLLSVYLFVYVVIFQMRLPGQSQLGYVIYVFAGLIPYIGFMESANSGCQSIRANMHLVKNVMLPIDLIPVRCVTVSMTGQLIGLVILLILMFIEGTASFHIFWLPFVIVLQTIFLLGLVWVLAGLAVLLPDLIQFVALVTLMLIFITPIGFTADMVPVGFSLVVDLNPIYYQIELYRFSLVYAEFPPPALVATNVCISCLIFFGGARFFSRFKSVLVDYE